MNSNHELEFGQKLAELEARSKSNSHRIDEMHGQIVAINRLATAVEVMATRQETMSKSVERLTGKVEALEAEPGEKWRFLMEKSLYFVIGAVFTYLFTKIGL